jgi:hypothetical protein
VADAAHAAQLPTCSTSEGLSFKDIFNNQRLPEGLQARTRALPGPPAQGATMFTVEDMGADVLGQLCEMVKVHNRQQKELQQAQKRQAELKVSTAYGTWGIASSVAVAYVHASSVPPAAVLLSC